MTEEGHWELPPGWVWAKAIEFSNVVGGGTPQNAKQPDNYSTNGIPWVTPADLSGYKGTHISRGSRDLSEKGFASCSAKKLPKGAVLLSSRAPVGYCVVAGNEICTNQGFKNLVLKSKEVVPEYLRYYLIGSKQYLENLASGTTFLELSGARVGQLLFPIAPASEQARIVSKIDELFSLIEEGERALERVQKLVGRYRQSVLKAAVTGELTREWRERHKGKLESGQDLLARILKARRAAWEKAELAEMKAKGIKPTTDKWKQKYQEPPPPDTSDLPKLPEGWAWASLPQLGEFGRGRSRHRPRNDPKLYGGKYPFLQTGTVRSSRGRVTEFDTTYNEIGLAQSKLWPAGTICITIAANIAASGILEFPACFPDSVVGLVPVADVVAEYVEFFIRTERSSLDRYAPATAQKNINLEILERVAVPLPPVEEQRAIYSKAQEKLSKIDDIERTLSKGLVQSNALRQSTLHSAFSGNLVAQDPADEPASILLGHMVTAGDQVIAASAQGREKKEQAA